MNAVLALRHIGAADAETPAVALPIMHKFVSSWGDSMSRVSLGLRTFCALALPYFNSEDRWRARALLAGVVCGELGYVFIAVTVIHWNARFFNALEARNWGAFKAELVVFGFITVGAILVGMAQYFFGQSLIIRWRRWMTERYVGMWM